MSTQEENILVEGAKDVIMADADMAVEEVTAVIPKIDFIGQEIDYYKANRKEFINLYAGKYLLIKGMQVVGVYNSNSEALLEGASLHEVGTFIIEHPVNIKIR